MSTKEKKRCDEPFVPSSRRRKVRKSSLERDRRCARKRKRGGVGEKRRARQSVQDTTFFFFPPSLFGTIESKTLSLFCVVVLTKALVSSPRRRRRSGSFIGILLSYIHHRTVFLLQNREQQHQARKSKGVTFSRREKHTQRAVLKCNSKTKSFSLSCWSYLPHPPSPRDRGRRESSSHSRRRRLQQRRCFFAKATSQSDLTKTLRVVVV